jgi:competence protein ComGC
MANQTAAQPRSLPRLPLILILTSVALLSSGCGLFGTHKKVQVPQLLTPLAEANSAVLIAEINRLAAVRSIHGKIDIVFEDTSFAEAGIAEKYKQADGQLTVQRPGNIYLIIQVPFIAKDIAQMTSNGESFRVAVLQGDEKYRRFVKGTNNATYEKLDMDGQASAAEKPKKAMNAKEAVNALSNLRPQHLTDALMLSPVQASGQSGLTYVRSEFYQDEADNRPQAKPGVRVVRGYFLLEEFSQPPSGEARLLRRFWFDRVSGIRLARLQSFNEQGLLITDVSYWDEKPFGETAQFRLPARIEITRPHDHYKLSIAYQEPVSAEINREFQPDAFVLENRWQLPEIDLDARQRNKATVTP